jgi:hypothetical protein
MARPVPLHLNHSHLMLNRALSKERQTMKISVVADPSGMVVAAVVPSLEPAPGRPFFSIQPKASETHTVHQIDLPEELFAHLGKETLMPELFKYRIDKKGRAARVPRPGAER